MLDAAAEPRARRPTFGSRALALVVGLFLAGCATQQPLPLVATAAPPRCGPVEIAPGKRITPMCGELPEAPVVPRAAWGLDGGSSGVGFLQGPVPAEVDLRPFDGPVRDQGQVGVCWAFALSSVMDNGARRAGDRSAMMSSLHVIAKGTWDDVWRREQGKPLALESLWPYDERKACAFNEDPQEQWCEREHRVRPGSWRSDPRLVAELEIANRSHRYLFRNVRHVGTKPVSIDELAGVLANGHALWASFDFNEDAWSSRELRDGVFSDYEQAGSFGHAVQITGYRTALGQKHFLLKNSWGTDWGQGGYAWMAEDLVRRHLRRAFFLDVAASQGAPPPIPVAFPLPLPAGWPWQLPPVLPTSLPNAIPSLPFPSPRANPTPAPPILPAVLPPVPAIPFPLPQAAASCPSGKPPVFGVCLP
jgi:hypothetical protein